MEQYTIYCTEEQTKKALELGAPIEVSSRLEPVVNRKYFSDLINFTVTIIPTSEQMIGWLEEQEGISSVEVTESFGWHYRVKKKHDDVEDWIRGTCQTRKETTIAAIDAALEYLSNNKIK